MLAQFICHFGWDGPVFSVVHGIVPNKEALHNSDSSDIFQLSSVARSVHGNIWARVIKKNINPTNERLEIFEYFNCIDSRKNSSSAGFRLKIKVLQITDLTSCPLSYHDFTSEA